MKNIKALMVLAALSLFIIGCGGDNGESQADFTELNKVIPVSVTTAQKRDVTDKKTFSGNLEGIRQSNIVAKISERIVSIKVQVGQAVSAGQVLIELDRTGQSSQYLQAQASYENSKRELDRMQALYEEGAVAKQTVDQAQTAFSVAKANYDAARSAVELTTPVSGRVTAINVNTGDWVTPGTVLAVVADINQMIINFNVSETEIANLKAGTPVRVYSEFNRDNAQSGRITEISRSASIDARSFKVKAQFSNTPDAYFKPGMYVKADVILQETNDVLTVPTEAVLNQQSGNNIYVINNGMSFLKKVQTGFGNDEYTQITEGLSEGDSVVYAGMNNLSDSTRVSIVNK